MVYHHDPSMGFEALTAYTQIYEHFNTQQLAVLNPQSIFAIVMICFAVVLKAVTVLLARVLPSDLGVVEHRNAMTYLMQLIVNTWASVALIMTFPFLLKFQMNDDDTLQSADQPPSWFANLHSFQTIVTYGVTPLLVLWVLELGYRHDMRFPLFLHHITAVLLVTYGLETLRVTGDLRYISLSIAAGCNFCFEAPTFLAMFLRTVKALDDVPLRTLMTISAWWGAVVKPLTWCLVATVWYTNIFSKHLSRWHDWDAAWVCLFPFLQLMLVATQIQDIKLQFAMAHRPASSGSRMRRRTSLQVAQNRGDDSRSVGAKTQLFGLSGFIAVCGIATAVLLQVPLTKRNFMHALSEQGIISAVIAADFAPARVAVVGGGIAGLTAAWQLSQTGRHAVTVFEARDYLGGNCHRICWNHTDPAVEPVCTTEAVAVAAGEQYFNMIEMLKELEVPIAWSTLPWDPQRRGVFDCTAEKMALGGCTQVPLPSEKEINRYRNLFTQEHEFTANVTVLQLLEKHKFSKELIMLITISGGVFYGNGIELPANVYRSFGLNQAPFAIKLMQWGSEIGEDSAGNGESNRPRQTDEHIHKMVQQMRQRGVEFALSTEVTSIEPKQFPFGRDVTLHVRPVMGEGAAQHLKFDEVIYAGWKNQHMVQSVFKDATADWKQVANRIFGHFQKMNYVQTQHFDSLPKGVQTPESTSLEADALSGWVPYIKVDDGSTIYVPRNFPKVLEPTSCGRDCGGFSSIMIADSQNSDRFNLSNPLHDVVNPFYRKVNEWTPDVVMPSPRNEPELPFSHIGSIDPSNVMASRWYPNIRRNTEWFTAVVNLHKLQGRDGVWFAGNELTINSHEMAMVTGMVVADALGAPYPYPHALSAKRNFIAVRNLMLHGLHQF